MIRDYSVSLCWRCYVFSQRHFSSGNFAKAFFKWQLPKGILQVANFPKAFFKWNFQFCPRCSLRCHRRRPYLTFWKFPLGKLGLVTLENIRESIFVISSVTHLKWTKPDSQWYLFNLNLFNCVTNIGVFLASHNFCIVSVVENAQVTFAHSNNTSK